MALGDFPSILFSDPNRALGVAPDMWKMLTEQDMVRQQAQLAQQAQADISNALMNGDAQNQLVHKFPPNSLATAMNPSGTQVVASRARELFLKRMGGIRAEMLIAPGDFLQCHIHGEVVHVFYCFGGKPGVTQESIDLFPSDTLITQFRMILA
jgi:oxalate decarboxylase/phosphoglucose isomerase-like protein (cupin superfamily)